jgi:hypothetical protein
MLSTVHTTTSSNEGGPQTAQFDVLVANGTSLPSSPSSAPFAPIVNLIAASGRTITFKRDNGQTVGDAPAQTSDVPHLVLYRNGTLTAPEERTLIVEVSGIQMPPSGVTVTLEMETQHWDPDLRGGDAFQGISVWRESQGVTNASAVTQTGGLVIFTHEFTASIDSGSENLATPTDYFRYDIAVIDAQHPITNPLNALSADHALLMENQVTAPLPDVLEASGGAAPDELIVYYCDMFPFQNSIRDPTTWLLRKDVSGYVQEELLPLMVDAFRRQTDAWGFPWYDAWTSLRSGEDAERISVALSDGATWYHGQAPYKGNSLISLKSTGGNLASYDTLTDALMSTFHHELFHNLQQNIQQQFGGHGSVSGRLGAWAFFSEGTAVMASSVGQPDVHFAPDASTRDYLFHTNHFLKNGGANADLDTSSGSLFPYRAALYWRFLFEGCGGRENPASGMQVIRRALTLLYSGQVVDIAASTSLVEELPAIIDRALAGSSCPFQTHHESLVAFAAAINALRLDGGRCTGPGSPTGCGFYDPHALYHDPLVNTVAYSGGELVYRDGIQSSFGMDFVDVFLNPAVDGKALTVELLGDPHAEAQFDVQLLFLLDDGSGFRPRRATVPTIGLEAVPGTGGTEHLITVIPAINTDAYNRLALIITRLDPDESLDPEGRYVVAFASATEQADSGGE